MKVVLVGHPGSQHIVPISKLLIEKYFPPELEVTFLNHAGAINDWSKYVSYYLSKLTDELVIFALDDYLIAEDFTYKKIAAAAAVVQAGCENVKLCRSTFEEHNEYPVTTQYTIWNREKLLTVLEQVKTPWEFEIEGSKYFNKRGWVARVMHCIEYNTSSCLSNRWSGVDLKGVRAEDLKEMRDIGLLDFQVDPLTTVPKRRKAVVFGGSGFLGTALIERLLTRPDVDVVAMARNEGNLVALKEKFPAITIMVGDISDAWSVKSAMVDADEVYLLSAMKHVGLAETEANACVLTNIIGTMNVINESLQVKPTVLMFISSDKAASGNGVYGGSKKIGERLMAEAERMNPATKYRVIRYGNVWASTGSIATKWRPKMERGEEVIITDPEASRFFWTVDEAVDLIFECFEKATSAAPHIPKMKAVKMGTVLEAMMDVYGQSPVKVIGLQPGENKVETTDGKTFSDQCEQFSKEEFKAKFLASPCFNVQVLKERVKTLNHPKITAVLITREAEYPKIIMERLQGGFFDEMILVTGCQSILDRYLAASRAKNEIIYVQDDDCLVNYQVLFRSYNGQITNAMTEPFIEKYKDSGCTLVGWGCYFPKSAVSALEKYIAVHGEEDPHLLREADRIFTALNRPWNTVVLPHEDLPQDPTRMGYQPEHYESMAAALAKVEALV